MDTSPQLLKRSLRVGLIIKAIDGVLQLCGSALLLVIKPGTLNRAVVLLTQHELSEDPEDVIAQFLLRSAHQLGAAKMFGAWYLFSHGLIKLLLVAAVLRQALWAYPALVGFLLVGVTYQLYRYSYGHSLWLVLLSLYDALIAWLVWHEYRPHQRGLIH